VPESKQKRRSRSSERVPPAYHNPNVDRSKLFIGNLLKHIDADDLKHLLRDHRPIEVEVIPINGKDLKFAFIKFASEQEATRVMDEFHGSELDGQAMRIAFARNSTRGHGPPPVNFIGALDGVALLHHFRLHSYHP